MFKCKQDQIILHNKLQRQLSNDFLRLYVDSHLVDLRLKAHKKDVLCHSLVIQCRCISLWSLIIQLDHHQKRKRSGCQNLIISLPSVDHFLLDSFIRSLYTEEIYEELWPSLKLQIEACFTVPYPYSKPFAIESLDNKEEKQLEFLIANQINKGNFTLKKSGLKNVSRLFSDLDKLYLPDDVAKRSCFSLSCNRVEVNNPEVVRMTSGHRGSAGMTSERTTNCSFQEFPQPNLKSIPPAEDNISVESRSRCRRGSKINSSRNSTHSCEHAHELNQDKLYVHNNGVQNTSAFQYSSSLEVELESSNEKQILSPDSSRAESFYLSTDQPVIIPSMTRTKTFEVITPLTKSICFSAVDLDSGASCAGQQNVDRYNDVEQRKGSLIFDNNFQTFSSIPSKNLMTLSVNVDRPSVNGASVSQETALPADFPYTSQGGPEKNSLADAAVSVSGKLRRKKKMAADWPDTDSPSPDSLYVDDPSRPKEEYDSEEKEQDDSESFAVDLLINTSSIDEVPTPPCMPKEEVPRPSETEDGPASTCNDIRTEKGCGFKYVRNYGGIAREVDELPVIEAHDAQTLETFDHKTAKGQSIFSMFIDFNKIPSPQEAKSRQQLKSHSSVYMFIEANGGSLTGRRKLKEERLGSEVKEMQFAAKISDPKLDSSDTQLQYPASRESLRIRAQTGSGSAGAKAKPLPKDTSNKGYYMFIETGSNSNSPKPRRRLSSQNRSSNKENFMSKSAPTDSHLFKGNRGFSKSLTPNNTIKMMTKSVINRDEFMSQPQARRNVSLNEKINETSKIPRPVANFRQRFMSRSSGKRSSSKEIFKDDFALYEPNHKVEREYDDISHVSGFSISEDVSDVSSLLNNVYGCSVSDRRNSGTLGDDLLRLFEKEIYTDVAIQVGERKIRAHKCILSSRCVYFAATLSGHWVERAGNIIKLQGFSAEAVVVALKHIYSGKSTVPPGVKTIELAALSDMLSLDGLKEVVTLHMKANQCHYFHKPCADCLIGVVDVLPIADSYYLDDLFRRCLKWISKYFTLVLPTRGFSSLSSDLQARCIKQIIDDVSVSSAIDTVMGCERVLCLLPAVKWAHGIIDLSSHLFKMVKTFITSNFSNVLSSDRFLSMNTDLNCSIDKMEEALLFCCAQLKLDEAISTHIKLSNILWSRNNEGMITFSDMFVDMLTSLLERTEKILMDNANRVSICSKWPLLAPDVQRKIKDASMILLETGKLLSAKPKLSSINKVRGSSIEPMVRARASSMSDSKLSRSTSSTIVPSQKTADGRKLKTTSERCQTPPGPLIRHCLQTPLGNKTSTLRAQAAIQRSQSARCVPERSKKKFSNANIEDKRDMNSKDWSRFTHSDRSRPSTRSNTLSTGQIQCCGSRPLTPHKKNYSGSHLIHIQKNSETEDNIGSKRQGPSSSEALCTNYNTSIIPKPIRAELPVIQKQSVMSSSTNESQLIYFNSEDCNLTYENITSPKFPPTMARSNTFSKD